MVGVEAVAFVLVGCVEYATRSLFWNDQVIRSNEFHTYFRVNSVFWDPNIYGRYLALVIGGRDGGAAVGQGAAQASGAADGADRGPLDRPGADLLAVELPRPAGRPGGARGAALELRWTLGAVGVGVVGGGPGRRSWSAARGKITSDRINIDTSGRANLVSGGLDLFAERPI